MSMSASYKPSPLPFGSPRASPFRRPDSTVSPSPSPLRQSTTSPSSPQTMLTPSRLNNSAISNSAIDTSKWTARGLAPTYREPEPSPTKGPKLSPGFGGPLKSAGASYSNDNSALSQLPPAQVRELREGFQILDRDSDGQVGREDVADMLTQLGLSSTPSELTAFFPPSTPQTVTLPTFLNSLATLLTTLSPTPELLNAFSAFDEDDSGQVDYAELRDALLHTAPESGEHPLTEREIDRVMSGFTGRRAFGKHSGAMGGARRAEVFKYQEFVASIAGGLGPDGKGEKNSDDSDE